MKTAAGCSTPPVLVVGLSLVPPQNYLVYISFPSSPYPSLEAGVIESADPKQITQSSSDLMSVGPRVNFHWSGLAHLHRHTGPQA